MGRCSWPTGPQHPPVRPAAIDRCPETGRARLSYRRAEALFQQASGGWTQLPCLKCQLMINFIFSKLPYSHLESFGCHSGNVPK